MTQQVFLDRSNRSFDEEQFADELTQALDRDNYYLALDYAVLLKSCAKSDYLALRGIEAEAICFDRLGIHDLELHAYEEALFRFGESSDPEVHEAVTRLMLNKAITLGDAKKTMDALAVYDQTIKRLKAEDTDTAKARLVRALANRAVVLRVGGRVEAAAQELSSIIDEFEAYKPTMDIVADSMRALAWLHVEREHFGKALTTYDKYLSYVREYPELDDEKTTEIKLNRATVLTNLKRFDDALVEYEQILSETEGKTSPSITRQVAFALYNKASILVDQQRSSEAKGILQRLIRDFSNSSDEDTQSAARDGLKLLEDINTSEANATTK